MKNSLFVFLLFLSNCLSGQLVDYFTDGNFLENPVWEGDTQYFQVNSNLELQSKGPSANGELHLSTANTLINNAEWIFWARLEFNPSTSNFARVYLVSDKFGLGGDLNGYFLLLGGESGVADAVELYKQTGNSKQLLLRGRDGTVGKNDNLLKIKISRTAAGEWNLYTDTLGGNNFTLEGSIVDNSFNTTNWFGVYCKHTTTRNEAFYFDNFEIKSGIADTIKPQIQTVNVLSANYLEIIFSEIVTDSSTKILSNYFVSNGLGQPITATRDLTNNKIVRVSFSGRFVTGTRYLLAVNGVKDYDGNAANDTASFEWNAPQLPKPYDLIITEIMADPDPAVDLPNFEYVELYNRSNYSINLENFKFMDATSETQLINFDLLPGNYILLCDLDNAPAMAQFGDVIGIQNFMILNNTGDNLSIVDMQNTVIHSVAYTDKWYQNEQKKVGGWSLEMIDIQNVCIGVSNWKASNDSKGGTPGENNSHPIPQNPTYPIEIQQVLINNGNQLVVECNRALDENAVANATITLSPNQPQIQSVGLQPNKNNTLIISLSSKIDTNIAYTLTLTGLQDCAHNPNNQTIAFEFALPVPADSNDILINEILFNPRTNSKRYVELYNNSNKIINLKGWLLARKNLTNATLYDYTRFCDKDILFYPKRYLCVTEDTTDVIAVYLPPNERKMLETPRSIPAYDYESDICVLLKADSTLIDALPYKDNYHFGDLNSTKGVALERLSFSQPTSSASNWHSAASTVNYGTPGYKNSQQLQPQLPDRGVSLNPQTFSPDADGFDDVLSINYNFSEVGNKAKILIFNTNGQLVKTLIPNTLLPSQKGNFTWDGTLDSEHTAPIGIYLILFELINPNNGSVEQFKLGCVLAKKL